MGKGHRHLKQLKSEKAKVKLKAKKTKSLPKGLNVTDTSFKVKKIIIREQLKQRDETEILSKRKLNVKELLSRLQHHNSTVRQEAVRELKEILSQHSPEILSSQFSSLLQGVSALCLDKERDIRRDSVKVLTLILSPISNEQLAPFCDILISYLKCAMTHIDPHIKEDALLFMDVLIQNCGALLAKNSHKILPIFLDMISRLHSETKPGRQLTTTLNSKNTTVKWRIKVLERLANMFASIVDYQKSQKQTRLNTTTKVVHVNNHSRYIPIFNEMQLCNIDFAEKENLIIHSSEKALDAEELMKYVGVLMPLMLDSWIEVCPEEKMSSCSELIISSEAATLLKSLVQIIQLIIESIEMLENDSGMNMRHWFRDNFLSTYTKNLLLKFPYTKSRLMERARKHQEDFSTTNLTENCLEQNLALCQIYVWFTSVDNNNIIDKSCKNFCISITKYVKDKMENWNSTDTLALPQLTKLLRTLFLRASKIWYKNHINMNYILKAVINTCSQSKKDLQSQLFIVLSDIMLDHTLNELHSEEPFKEFVSTLPNLLLKPSIHENTILMINRVVLRHKGWLKEKLAAKQEAIIENAKKIEIIGSEDEKLSRLMICNLLYFIDGQIYF